MTRQGCQHGSTVFEIDRRHSIKFLDLLNVATRYLIEYIRILTKSGVKLEGIRIRNLSKSLAYLVFSTIWFSSKYSTRIPSFLRIFISFVSIHLLPLPRRLSFYLRICLIVFFSNLEKTTKQILIKFSENVETILINKYLDFGSNPNHHLDLGMNLMDSLSL